MSWPSFVRAALSGLIVLLLIGVLAAIAWHGWQTRPHLPLDLPANDPGVRAAFDTAIVRHVLIHGAMMLAALLAARGLDLVVRRAWRGDDIASLRHAPTEPAPTAGQTVRGPRRVVLLRHAEKTGEDGDIHLSKAGFARAKRLATYIPETFGMPVAIFAAPRTPKSARSIETVTPLSLAINVAVSPGAADAALPEFVRALFSDPALNGGTIVVCWQHHDLPEIARLLGAPANVCPAPWPEDVFNAIIDIIYDDDGNCTAQRLWQPF